MAAGFALAKELNVSRDARKEYRTAVSKVHSTSWGDAEAHFRQAVRECPTFARAFNGLGVVLNKPLEAVPELQDVLSTDPKNKEAVTLLADIYVAIEDNAAAMRLLDYADTREIPHDPEFHFNLAQILENQRATDAAAKQYERYLTEAPSGTHSNEAREHMLATIPR